MTTDAAPIDPLMLDLFRVELENNTRMLEAGLVTAERDQVEHSRHPRPCHGRRSFGGTERKTAADLHSG